MILRKGKIQCTRISAFEKITKSTNAQIIDLIWDMVPYKIFNQDEFLFLEQGIKENANRND